MRGRRAPASARHRELRQPQIGQQRFRHDLAAALGRRAATLPAAADQHGAVWLLLQRQQARDMADHRLHQGGARSVTATVFTRTRIG